MANIQSQNTQLIAEYRNIYRNLNVAVDNIKKTIEQNGATNLSLVGAHFDVYRGLLDKTYGFLQRRELFSDNCYEKLLGRCKSSRNKAKETVKESLEKLIISIKEEAEKKENASINEMRNLNDKWTKYVGLAKKVLSKKDISEMRERVNNYRKLFQEYHLERMA